RRRAAGRGASASTTAPSPAPATSRAPQGGTLVSGPPPGSILGRERSAPSASLGREGRAPGGGFGREGVPGGLGREGAQPRRQAPAGQRPSPGQQAGALAGRRVPGSLGREGTPSVAAPLEVARRQPSQRAGSQPGQAARAGADALPPGLQAAARLDAPVLRTDRNALVTGIIWHEVLSEPVAKRRLRRTRSRPLRP